MGSIMINDLVNFIKSRLGSSKVKLELTDEDIINILQQETLKTISAYNPFFLEYNLDTTKEAVEGSLNTFYIPDDIYGFHPFGVEKVINSSTFIGQPAWGILGGDMRTAMEFVINSRTMASLETLTLPPQTFQFIPPNILRINSNYLPVNNNFLLLLKKIKKKKN